MKITAAALIASLAAVASADMLQIYNPTKGTIWNAGDSVFIGWSGNCASMGATGKNVTVNFVQGPSGSVHFVAALGTLDCSGSSVRQDYTVPTLTPGAYSIVVQTSPEASYTNEFTINGAGGAGPSSVPSAAATTSAPPASKPSNAAGSLTANVMFAVAGAVAVASQML